MAQPQVQEEVFQAMNKEIHRPINCDSLKETKVNPGMLLCYFGGIHRQKTLNSEVFKTAWWKQSATLSKSWKKKQIGVEENNFDMAMNAIGLLGQGNRWLKSCRKEYHNRYMDPRLHHLCSVPI